MPLPTPVPGLVIRYSFLWSHEAKIGLEDGGKDRPCAVLLTTITKDVLLFGEALLPGRPVALMVVALSIAAVSLTPLSQAGLTLVGSVPSGMPGLGVPGIGVRDVDGVIPLAFACVLLAYIEGVSAARTFAEKHGYPLDVRQELLGLGSANLLAAFGGGYPVAGGLSQSAVNDQAGAKTPLALVVASATLGLCLVFLTGLVHNLPKAVLAAIVLVMVSACLPAPSSFLPADLNTFPPPIRTNTMPSKASRMIVRMIFFNVTPFCAIATS